MKNKSQILQYKIRSYINDIPMEGREVVWPIVDGLGWVRRGVNATETSLSNKFSSAILIHSNSVFSSLPSFYHLLKAFLSSSVSLVLTGFMYKSGRGLVSTQ